jgi:hypothetical protein
MVLHNHFSRTQPYMLCACYVQDVAGTLQTIKFNVNEIVHSQQVCPFVFLSIYTFRNPPKICLCAKLEIEDGKAISPPFAAIQFLFMISTI